MTEISRRRWFAGSLEELLAAEKKKQMQPKPVSRPPLIGLHWLGDRRLAPLKGLRHGRWYTHLTMKDDMLDIHMKPKQRFALSTRHKLITEQLRSPLGDSFILDSNHQTALRLYVLPLKSVASPFHC